MKKLISLLCIAAVSVTFSYTDIAEARSDIDEQEMNLINSNTKSHGRSAKKNRNGKQKKQKRSARKNKKRSNKQNFEDSNSQNENDNYDEENTQRNSNRRRNKNSDNRNIDEDEIIDNENSNEEVNVQDNNFKQNRNSNFKQKKNKKRRSNKKKKNNKRNKRKQEQQEEVLYNDAQYDMTQYDNDEVISNTKEKRKSKKNKKQRRSKKNKQRREISNNKERNDDKSFKNTGRKSDIGSDEIDTNNDWKNIVALADENGYVTNPQVNSSIMVANNKAQVTKKSEPAIRITKGLTRHIVLGTDTKQLIQPKHNYKKGLKETIQLRQELEKYRRMFARTSTPDETA